MSSSASAAAAAPALLVPPPVLVPPRSLRLPSAERGWQLRPGRAFDCAEKHAEVRSEPSDAVQHREISIQ